MDEIENRKTMVKNQQNQKQVIKNDSPTILTDRKNKIQIKKIRNKKRISQLSLQK